MQFINRVDELASLEKEYKRKDGSLVVIYGRRRTGKTTLIRKFIQDKPAVYYLADKQLEQQQQQSFKDLLSGFLKDDLLQSLNVSHWDQLFNYLEAHLKQRRGKKLILVLDEFQYLANSNAAFPSMLQRYWDNHLADKNIMLILCGSLISMIFKHALNYNAPLFGRRTAQIHVHPFRYEHIHPFVKEKNEKEKMEFYGLCGGIPRYLLEMQTSKSIFQNIKEQVLDRNRLLFNEPRFILNDELSETSTYFSLLKVIAEGNHKIGNIAQVLQIPNNRLTAHLDKLRELDVIERIVPVTENNPAKSRRGLYFIKDNFMRFWFRYVFPFHGELEMGNTAHVLSRIQADFSNYMGGVFEDTCRQFIYRVSPFSMERVGKYWDKNTEIDLVALNEQKKQILFGECKWTNQQIDLRELNALRQKAKAVEWHNEKRKEFFVLFAKNGFRDDIIKEAKRDVSVLLVDFNKGQFSN